MLSHSGVYKAKCFITFRTLWHLGSEKGNQIRVFLMAWVGSNTVTNYSILIITVPTKLVVMSPKNLAEAVTRDTSFPDRPHSRQPPFWFSKCHANQPCVMLGANIGKKVNLLPQLLIFSLKNVKVTCVIILVYCLGDKHSMNVKKIICVARMFIITSRTCVVCPLKSVQLICMIIANATCRSS